MTNIQNPKPDRYKIRANEDKTIFMLLSGKKNQNRNIEVDLQGEGSSAKILGVIVGKGEDDIVLNTLQKHSAANTTSDLLVKGVFFDKSKFKYRGLIEIDKDAQNSNAFQQENNLVLSKDVDIDTRPELEIEANEVRCTHAATVGQIDEEQIYYMTTRGLTQTQAKELIIEGFLGEVISRISDRKIRKSVDEKVKKLLRN
jgi:Fe-S cluster assembly protein SufD